MTELDFIHKPLSDMDEDEKHYLIDYSDTVSRKYTETANKSFAEANNTEQSLSSQLMLLNTVILTASLLTISSADIYKLITPAHKIMICGILILQILSIYSGIVSYMMRYRFFGNAGVVSLASAKIAKERKYPTVADMDKNLETNDLRMERKSSAIYLWVQITFIALSLGIFGLLIAAILYDLPYY